MSKVTCEHSGIEFESNNGWISVDDQLPNMELGYSEDILFTDGLEYHYGHCRYIDEDNSTCVFESFILTVEIDVVMNITHWMPLPTLPNNKINEDDKCYENIQKKSYLKHIK